MPREFFLKRTEQGLQVKDDFKEFSEVDFEVIASTYQYFMPGFDLAGLADYLIQGRAEITQLDMNESIYLPGSISPSKEVKMVHKLLDTPHGVAYLGLFNHEMPDYDRNLLQIISASKDVPAVRLVHLMMHGITGLINDNEGYDAFSEDDTMEHLEKQKVAQLFEGYIEKILNYGEQIKK